MASFDDIFAGAVSGAGVGAATGNPIGIAGGALIGGLYSAFSKKPPVPKYVDTNAAVQRQIAGNLATSEEGRQTGAVQGANAIRRAEEESSNLEQDPALANNPFAKAALRNKLIRGAEGTAVNAATAGAESDRSAQMGAANIYADQSRQGYEHFLNEEKMRREPTAMQMLAYQGIGSLAGQGASEVGRMISPNQQPGQGQEPEWSKRVLELLNSSPVQDLSGTNANLA